MFHLNRENFNNKVSENRDGKIFLIIHPSHGLDEVTLNSLLLLEKEFPEVSFFTLDGEKEKILAFNYQAFQLPSFILISKGEIIGSGEGDLSTENLRSILEMEEEV